MHLNTHNKGGTSVRDNIRKLLSIVPREPGTLLPLGATDDDIAELESKIGFSISPDLRDWLRISNGPCVGPGGLFGVGDVAETLSIYYYSTLYPEWMAKRWIPIAGDGCGNYYLLVTGSDFGDGQPVVFVEPIEDPSTPAYIAASDIWHFLEFLLQKELKRTSWPFDKTEVLKYDAAIASFTNISLPWE